MTTSLRSRLLSNVSPDTVAASRRVCLQLLEAALERDDAMRRRARLIALLFVDALNADRSEPRRTMRWQRFISALAVFASDTQSPPLLRLAAENADLLRDAPYAIQTV